MVLPISYYERANNAYYNSLAIADADGTIVGRYRKSHIPDGPGCAPAAVFAEMVAGIAVTDLGPASSTCRALSDAGPDLQPAFNSVPKPCNRWLCEAAATLQGTLHQQLVYKVGEAVSSAVEKARVTARASVDAQVPGEVVLHARRHRLQSLQDQVRHHWRPRLLGPGRVPVSRHEASDA